MKIGRVIGLLCVFAIAGACTTGGTHPVTTAAGCTPDNNPAWPVVCVDDNATPPTLSTKDVHVFNKDGNNGTTRVTWKSKSGSPLDIKVSRATDGSGTKCYKSQWPKPYCVDDTCEIKVNPGAAKKRCDYKIWANGREVDPVIIVDECCSLNQ